MTRFTLHAIERVRERLHLTADELVDIIEKNLVVPLGKDKGTNKVHLLFYSIVDDLPFIAVFDEVTKEIVTLLPVDYHNRWRVSDTAVLMARQLAIKSTAETESSVSSKAPVHQGPAKVRVSGYIRTPSDKVQIIPLLTFWSDQFGFDLDSVMANPKVRHMIKNSLASNGGVETVVARLGKKGPIQSFSPQEFV